MDYIYLLEEYMFIKEYYISLIVYFVFLIGYSFLTDIKRSYLKYYVFNIITVCYSLFLIYKIGNRSIDVGTDTKNYHFMYYYDDKSGDLLFDILGKFFNNIGFDFSVFMTFCAGVYIFGTLYACKNFFNKNYFYAFIIFLIYPYFMLFGINGVRNGMAASMCLLGLSIYHNKNNKRAVVFLFISILLHLSMIIPIIVFLFRRFLNYNKQLFIIWLFAIILMLLNINILGVIVPSLPFIGPRFGSYVSVISVNYDLLSFLTFGIPPIVFAIYAIYKKKFNDRFYIDLLNMYLLIHIFYVFLLKTVFSIRIGYLAEFLMIVLISYPLFSYKRIFNSKFFYTIWSCLIFSIFLIKAYKILVL